MQQKAVLSHIVLLSLCIVSLSTTSFALTCAECDFVIVSATSGTYTILDNAQLGLAPGSILCYSAENTYSTAYRFANFAGTAAQPFVVTNCNGIAIIHTPNHAIESNNNKHIRFTGKYDETSNETYGLRITRSAKGIDLTLGTTNVEVDHMEITGCEGHAAISVKTDPTYGNQYHRPNFVMRDIWLHHNFIHDVDTEAYYVGYSAFETSEAHTIEGLRLHSNVIKRTGWDGIQVGAAIADTKVYNNYVYNYATTNTENQNSGIILLGGFKGEVYNNWVQDGPGVGILYHGNGDTSVYNNVVINANIAAHVSDSRYNPGTYTAWHHNTVINPGANGIKVFVSNQAPIQTHHAKNNVVIGATEDCLVLSNPNDVDNNICLGTAESLFNNPAVYDFAPAFNSSLINTGVTCTPNPITIDYNDGNRDNKPDVGAFEYGTKPRNDDNTGNDVDDIAASKASSLSSSAWLL